MGRRKARLGAVLSLPDRDRIGGRAAMEPRVRLRGNRGWAGFLAVDECTSRCVAKLCIIGNARPICRACSKTLVFCMPTTELSGQRT